MGIWLLAEISDFRFPINDENSGGEIMVGSYKAKPWRWVKTLFFLATMMASLLLVCAPPLLIAILDMLVPSALLSAASKPPFSAPAQLIKNHTFQTSLADVPIISTVRSLLILCVYLVCSGRGPYLGITTVCSFASVGYVSMKAVIMYGRRMLLVGSKEGVLVEALFLSSLAFAVAHIVVAYRTSCRERRKLLVYRIDIEAVLTYHNDFPSYHKIGLTK